MGADRKKLELMALVAVAAVMALICLPIIWPEKGQTAPAAPSPIPAYAGYAGEAEKLESLLSRIKGAGRVEVMITYGGEAEKVPAYESSANTASTQDGEKSTLSESASQQPAFRGDQAVVLTEKRPQVLGVIVVAEGAADFVVRAELARAVQVALGIEAKG